MISLPIENRKMLFKKYPNSFMAEDAIGNLSGLKFIQSNYDTDPKDPTRIITRVVTTIFSLSRDMAKNLCQTFMDAKLFENASDASKREFYQKGVYQITGKGAHIIERFVHRNQLSIEATRHITANATPRMLFLEREEEEDAIVLNQKAVDVIFKRFAGPRPNVTSSGNDYSPLNSSPGRDRSNSTYVDRGNGIEVRDQQQHNYDIYRHTFYGKAAIEWLLDYSTVITKEEAICIAQEMVNARYIEQVGEESRHGPALFKTSNSVLYHFTELGRAVLGWESLHRSRGSSISVDWMDERGPIGLLKLDKARADMQLLSTQFKLTSNALSRLPISVARERCRSSDSVSVTGSAYSFNGSNEDSNGAPIRPLSQLLSDPDFQLSLPDSAAMSSYAASSSGRESVGHQDGGNHSSSASSGGSASPLSVKMGGLGFGASSPVSSSSSMTATVQSVTSNTTRLNLILSNDTLREMFKSFLRQNFCEENLAFYLEVLEYKKRFNALINHTKSYQQSLTGVAQGPDAGAVPHPAALRELEKQICSQAFTIYESFLMSGAPREVNLPHQMRLEITSYMQAVVGNMEESPSGAISGAGPNAGAQGAKSVENGLPYLSHKALAGNSASYAANDTENGADSGRELIHLSLFDRIQEHIFRLMSTDSVPKFTKTDKYREVMMNRVKQNAQQQRQQQQGGSGGPSALRSSSPLGSFQARSATGSTAPVAAAT
ncbi:hypothetical protein BGW38_010360 [Lunasporangiospora selenospora]|uniref:Uncharacterized protein n=1 Tax=Lunasporangiospora selenospora TaxID=979761 RepID=A0A9P6FWS1_9FUNG|nr:hypothetical protein BGW38_010360 [Lunasporangiospora selenospora]